MFKTLANIIAGVFYRKPAPPAAPSWLTSAELDNASRRHEEREAAKTARRNAEQIALANRLPPVSILRQPHPAIRPYPTSVSEPRRADDPVADNTVMNAVLLSAVLSQPSAPACDPSPSYSSPSYDSGSSSCSSYDSGSSSSSFGD